MHILLAFFRTNNDFILYLLLESVQNEIGLRKQNGFLPLQPTFFYRPLHAIISLTLLPYVILGYQNL